jgi:hypothetical protein
MLLYIVSLLYLLSANPHFLALISGLAGSPADQLLLFYAFLAPKDPAADLAHALSQLGSDGSGSHDGHPRETLMTRLDRIHHDHLRRFTLLLHLNRLDLALLCHRQPQLSDDWETLSLPGVSPTSTGNGRRPGSSVPATPAPSAPVGLSPRPAAPVRRASVVATPTSVGAPNTPGPGGPSW